VAGSSTLHNFEIVFHQQHYFLPRFLGAVRQFGRHRRRRRRTDPGDRDRRSVFNLAIAGAGRRIV